MSVASHTPKDVIENKYSTVPSINNAIEPLIGICSHAITTSRSDNHAASAITALLVRILAMAISLARTGITSKCSMVPCSRSRITAAPATIIDNKVVLASTCIMAVNHGVSPLGLNHTLTTGLIGSAASSEPLWVKAATSCCTIWLM